ncbi:MAG TPA: ergothioneine biosynthesis protein EgtB [Myxococcales bacterium]|nr:ergothioneine biosynthesis protein EgtB [Myxococcales bacterium]
MSPAELLQLFVDSQAAVEAACAPLQVEDFVVQAMEDASPVKWHLAHTAWFFETFVLAAAGAGAGYQPFDSRYRWLFNSYYEAVGDRHPRPERGLLSRPTLEEVRRYRRHVGDGMRRLLEGARSLPPALAFAVELGANHAEQHHELIATDVKMVLAGNPLHPPYAPRPAPAAAAGPLPMGWVGHDGGLCEVGHAGDAFAFDNERPRHRVFLEPFQLADRLVTCGEYLEFIEAGGYREPMLWFSDGWTLRQQRGWEAPLYWSRAEDGGWEVASLYGAAKVDPLEPVCHVSFYEADAYARWRGARLPLETEWELVVARQGMPRDGRWLPHPEPLGAAPAPGEIAQAFGAAWQWTQSPYVAYPGFRPFDGAFGEYNGKFMSNQLVLRGSSCVTPPRHARVTYRNFFRPDARWQFTGIRLGR